MQKKIGRGQKLDPKARQQWYQARRRLQQEIQQEIIRLVKALALNQQTPQARTSRAANHQPRTQQDQRTEQPSQQEPKPDKQQQQQWQTNQNQKQQQ